VVEKEEEEWNKNKTERRSGGRETSNLEAVVEDRTRQLMEEKAKIDHLLYNMMPASVYLLTYCLISRTLLRCYTSE